MEVQDFANSFLQPHNYERVLVIICEKLAEMMVRIDPSIYQKYVMYSNNGVPMLYVFLYNALYGMLRSALLFYKRLRSDLEDRGFVVNVYDPYDTNKMLYGAQINLCWHVDYIKISHREGEMVTVFSVEIANIYG